LEIGLFLEDLGHEKFIASLVRKVIAGVSPETTPQFDVRNAHGGKPRMKEALQRYIRDYLRFGDAHYDLLIIAQDTDCAGVAATKSEVAQSAAEYSGALVIAAPDPCIESWYLADQEAIRNTAGADTTPPLPSDCNCAALKQLILELFREGGLRLLLGGAEYADEIVEAMDLARAQQNVNSLSIFISDLRAAIAPYLQSP